MWQSAPLMLPQFCPGPLALPEGSLQRLSSHPRCCLPGHGCLQALPVCHLRDASSPPGPGPATMSSPSCWGFSDATQYPSSFPAELSLLEAEPVVPQQLGQSWADSLSPARTSCLSPYGDNQQSSMSPFADRPTQPVPSITISCNHHHAGDGCTHLTDVETEAQGDQVARPVAPERGPMSGPRPVGPSSAAPPVSEPGSGGHGS